MAAYTCAPTSPLPASSSAPVDTCASLLHGSEAHPSAHALLLEILMLVEHDLITCQLAMHNKPAIEAQFPLQCHDAVSGATARAQPLLALWRCTGRSSPPPCCKIGLLYCMNGMKQRFERKERS
jgi:hypothetical protein